MGKSPAIPPPIWKNPIERSLDASWYQRASSIMYSTPDRTTDELEIFSIMHEAANMLPRVESSHPGTKIGRFFSAAARSQECAGSI